MVGQCVGVGGGLEVSLHGSLVSAGDAAAHQGEPVSRLFTHSIACCRNHLKALLIGHMG